MTNILVKDDASTPVESTLVPVTDTPVSYWRARASGVPVDGQVQVWMSEEPVRGGEAVKRTIKLEVPVMETLVPRVLLPATSLHRRSRFATRPSLPASLIGAPRPSRQRTFFGWSSLSGLVPMPLLALAW